MSGASGYCATRFAPDPRRELVWQHVARYVEPFVPAGGRVLELGAGYCFFINRVAARRRVAVDIADIVKAYAAEGVEAVQADLLSYLRCAPESSFDFVFASNVFEHLEWPVLDEVIEHLVRVIAPSGRLCVIQPNFRLATARYFDDYTHRTVFSDVSLTDWLESAGFRVLRVEPRFLPLTVKSRLGAFPFLIPLYLRLPWRPFAGQMFVLAEA